MKNVLKPLDKGVLIPLGLTTAASATNTAIHKKIFGSGRPSTSHMTTRIILNEDMNDIMKMLSQLY